MPGRDIHLETALLARSLNLSPLPPNEDGSKSPLADLEKPDGGKTWAPYQTAPATEVRIKAWYANGRTGNGLATGYGNLECLEFDDAATFDEFKRTAVRVGLEGLVERIDSGYCEVTPGGGYHWLYRCEVVRPNTKLAERPIPGEPHKRKVLIETRGVNGFVVTAPSNGAVHPTGGAYRLLKGGLPSIATVTPEERDAAWEVARSFDEIPPLPAPAPRAGKRQSDGLRPGDAYEAEHSWEDILEPLGWSRVFSRGDVTYWRRPDKDRGISATTGHCKGLYVFTSSTAFRPNESYTKFGAYAAIHHGGDHAAAARALAKEGYGEPAAKRQPPDAGKPDVVVTEQSADDPINLTEWGNARRLVLAYGKQFRYCKSLGQWYAWDGTRWSPDIDGAIWRRAKDTVRQLGHVAANTEDDQRRQATLKWALKSEERKVLSAMIELAWSEPGVTIAPDQLDRDPWLLNTPGGTVNLKTGRVRRHDQSDMISRRTSVACHVGGPCPRWRTALGEIFAGDEEMIGYIQRAFGYSLTGIVAEHALFLCYGTGRNGKNTILEVVQAILNDYATVTDPRTFLSAGRGDHPAMLADLLGRRFVPTSEVEHGERLAEGLVKRVTGDKIIKARFMRQNPFEFPVLFKIWMMANCKPEVKGQDEGIWSRIRLIPFDVFIPPERRIKNLSDILVKQEGPAILGWLVEGCLEWQRIGLAEPAKVTDAVAAYRLEQDVIGDFLDARCVSYLESSLRETAKVKIDALYAAYLDWCKTNGEKAVLSSRKFGAEMSQRQFTLTQSNGMSYRMGLTLKADEEPSSDY